ncbi:MAG: MFS transporter [Bdellovibrionales bacterium]|nr:MFS transporter [Bdellovibrionales bacterium]
MSQTFKKRALITIFFTIFTDLLGFGMIIPLSPILAREFGADGLQVGLLISLYSFAQFLFAPLWGRLSDVFGRKPIILCGLLGVGFSHIWFGFSTTLTSLFLSRFLAGFFGGNISTAMAYIADVTEKKERSKNMGLIGMAFGLGFTIGPALGGLFVLWGHQLGGAPPFGASFAALGAGFISFVNCFMAGLFLKESRSVKKEKGTRSYLSPFKKSSTFSRSSPLTVWKSLLTPRLGVVLFMSFILWLALAQIEPTLILLVQDDFSWEKTSAYWGFAYIGLLMAFTQGVLVRKWIPRFGEKKVNQWGLLGVSSGLFFIGIASWFVEGKMFVFGQGVPLGLSLLTLGVTLFSLGYSLASTSLSGAVSLLSSSGEQGRVFGVNQSLASLARIAGPVLGGWAYRDLSHDSPFIIAGLMAFGIFYLAFRKRESLPDIGRVLEKQGKDSSVLKKKGSEVEDLELYSIDPIQLSHLLEKRIRFGFFYLSSREELSETGESVSPVEPNEALFFKEGENPPPDDLSSEGKKIWEKYLKKAQVKSPKEVLSLLKKFSREEPLVFVCETGELSKTFSKEVRDEGWKNAYYVEGGLSAFGKTTKIYTDPV